MSGSDTTIVYYTDNALDPEIAGKCRELLLRSANGHPIISVSQRPIDFGENVCVGDIGRSWLSLYKQLFEGVRLAKTKYVAMAEHDCIYSEEHLLWTPPRDDTFYYNDNCWLLQWKSSKPEMDGMFSYWPKRYALSQMISNTELMRRTIDKRLDILEKDRRVSKGIANICEPGRTRLLGEDDYMHDPVTHRKRLERVQRWAKSGKAVYLRPMLQDFSAYLETEQEERFKTKTPNLDIRHNGNFTGPKRGKNRRWELPPWGKLEEVLNGTNSNH